MTAVEPASTLPIGTLTFLFSDLEGSTRLWEQYPDRMKAALARHDALLRAAVEDHEGWIVKTTGDGLHAVFQSAASGTKAALQAQQSINTENWPAEVGSLRIRIGLHTGESQLREADYYGTAVNRAARIMSIGFGGQVLLSGTTAKLVQDTLPHACSLLDLGAHGLKDLSRPANLFQLCHPDLQAEFPPIKSLAAFKHNLPLQLTSFVGREVEIARIHELLPETHILSLVGPGGTGKTRLMLQAAAEVVDAYQDGVWLIELAPLADPDRIWEHMAAALRVQEQPGRALAETLANYLRPKQTLLLLDNVEHLVAASAEIVERLATVCPQIQFVVTGRERLNIDGETAFQIPALSLPGEGDRTDLDQVRSSAAVQLFIERARAARPDFDLTAGNAAAIGEITRRLDGIPLAIELAAARVQMLPVEQIVARLNDRFRLPAAGRRTALPRQQTLEALIAWSWNLLESQEQALLRRLSVFSGGWTLEVAETVAGHAIMDVFDSLAQLVDKSLLVPEHLRGGEVRYRMLESIREYGRARLEESGEGPLIRELHATYFQAFAEEAVDQLRGPNMVPWVTRMRLEVDNLRTMFDWLLENRPASALRVAGILFQMRVLWIAPREARAWLEAAMEALGTDEAARHPQDMAAAWIGLSLQLHNQGDYPGSATTVEKGLALAREAGEPLQIVQGLILKGLASTSESRGKVVELGEEAIAIARENGYKIELATALGGTAFAKIMQGDQETGGEYISEAIELARKFGSPWLIAAFLRVRGNLTKAFGDLREARNYFLEALEALEALGDRHSVTAIRSDLADLLRTEGETDEAEDLYRETILGWQESGHQPMIMHQLECFAYLAMASAGSPQII